MLHCNDIDQLMVDWLYGELESARVAEIEGHVDACARCQSEQAAFARTRELFTSLPSEEPPSAVTAMLVREAALSAKAPSQAAKAKATQAGGGGFGEWLSRLFRPMMHPAFAAVATLVLVVGIGGLLYLKKGEEQFAPPSVSSAAKSNQDDELAATPAAADPARGVAKPEPETTSAVALATESEGRAEGDEARVADIVSDKQAAKLRERQTVTGKGRKTRPGATKAPAQIATGSDEDADDAFADGVESKSEAFGYRGQKDGKKKDASWAVQKEQELVRAYKKEDCRGAAAIANDIRERDPKYYQSNTAELEAVKKCRPYVAAETKRRSARKAASKAKSKKKGGAKSDQAKAAPVDDSFDEAAVETE